MPYFRSGRNGNGGVRRSETVREREREREERPQRFAVRCNPASNGWDEHKCARIRTRTSHKEGMKACEEPDLALWVSYPITNSVWKGKKVHFFIVVLAWHFETAFLMPSRSKYPPGVARARGRQTPINECRRVNKDAVRREQTGG